MSEIDKLKAEVSQFLQVWFEVTHCLYYMQVFSLTKEHLLVEELYHQQQLTVAALRSECTQLKEIKALNEALSKEKEG